MERQRKPLLGLAPMAGITNKPMRMLALEYGADYACTEMVSAIGLMYSKASNDSYRRLVETDPREQNTALQLFGKDPLVMGEAARKATEMGRFSMIDLNMGCPARKVVSSGEGSALLKDPDLAFRLMEAVKISTPLPVTVKTRLGYDEESRNALLLAQAAQTLGLRWICIHGRTRQQMYSGQADWDAIGEIRSRVNIPVIANGDVFTGKDGAEMLRRTGADGLMVGRGAMGNPQLFRELRGVVDNGIPGAAATPAERLETALRHAKALSAFEGERLAVTEMRTHLGHYIAGLRGAAALRRQLCAVATLEEVEELLKIAGQLQESESPGSFPDKEERQ